MQPDFQMKDGAAWKTNDDAMILSVTLRNPGACTSSPTVFISVSSADTVCPMPQNPVAMIRDTSSVPFDGCVACGSGDRCNACVVCDSTCSNQDAAAQGARTSFYYEVNRPVDHLARADNEITVTLRANIELSAVTNIYMSGFVGGVRDDGDMPLSPWMVMSTICTSSWTTIGNNFI